MTTQVQLTPEEAGSLEHCPCGHNAWIQHHGVVEGSEPGCVHCDCPRTADWPDAMRGAFTTTTPEATAVAETRTET